MSSGPDGEATSNQASPDGSDDADDRVGVVMRLLGAVLLVLGLAVIGMAIWAEFIDGALRRRGFGVYCAIGGVLCSIGFYWVRGKRYFNARIDPESNTPEAGRAGMFDSWPEEFRAIVDQLRPALLATGAVFYGGDQLQRRKRPRVRIGWPGWWGSDYAVMAVVRPSSEGSLELSLRVGHQSELVSPEGPLCPVAEGKPPVNEYGSVILETPDVPPEVFDWIARAGQYTRAKCKLGPPPKTKPAEPL